MLSQTAAQLLKQLAAEGVSPWLVATGAREILPASPSCGAAAGLLRGAVAPAADPVAVRRACDALRGAFAASGGQQGRVSVPVDPRAAHDAAALVAAARTASGEVGRPNLLIRVPATTAGLSAMADCLAMSISVHADLVFSAERYEEFLDAYLTGMERALAAGRPLGRITASASVPVGVLDAEVDSRLPEAANPDGPAAGVRGTAAVALARQLHRLREQRLGGDWWRVLRAAGAEPPLLVWTGVGPWHVGELVGWNTAQAASLEVLEAAGARGGLRGDTLLNAHGEARRALAALEGLGVRMRDVAQDLEAAELSRLRQAWPFTS
ncbi:MULTISPECIES: transaldolase family protein [unclassified Streptomyces]|uniref:transaldolase family protein n=1 Tax=unclassified Streptomyces TaxID=2593676 RepID=UPI00068E7E92|nr:MULTISPECIES: transaldolase family protein [unclassified Streptomyces]